MLTFVIVVVNPGIRKRRHQKSTATTKKWNNKQKSVKVIFYFCFLTFPPINLLELRNVFRGKANTFYEM